MCSSSKHGRWRSSLLLHSISMVWVYINNLISCLFDQDCQDEVLIDLIPLPPMPPNFMRKIDMLCINICGKYKTWYHYPHASKLYAQNWRKVSTLCRKYISHFLRAILFSKLLFMYNAEVRMIKNTPIPKSPNFYSLYNFIQTEFRWVSALTHLSSPYIISPSVILSPS